MRPLHIFAGALLCGTLVLPVGLKAQESKRTTTTTTTTTETQRYYDPVEKDYHAWNDTEDHAYRVYLQDNHHDYLEFGKANEKERKEYFKWRHGHPDSVIIKEKEKH